MTARATPAPDGDDWQRQRRLAEAFGDVLPDTTSDERDPQDGAGGPGPGAPGTEAAGDAWLRAQVPPHHGD